MRSSLAVVSALVCAIALSSCGDTLQDKPIGPTALENVIVKSRFPVYWVGTGFSGMQVTAVTIDPGGAVTIQYGDCLVGGQYTCVTPLSIVTSPDNSFVPGRLTSSSLATLRGVRAIASQGAQTIAIPTGGVVVSVYAKRASLASAVARTMAPLNKVGLPFATLPASVPDTGIDRVPLPSQVPPGAVIPSTPAPKRSGE